MVASLWIRGAMQSASRQLGSVRFYCHLTRRRPLQFSSCRNGVFSKRGCFHPGVTNIARDVIKNSNAGSKRNLTGKDMLKKMVSYIWPKDNPEVKKRVLIALSLLVCAKLLNISVPFLFKHTVDTLNVIESSSQIGTLALTLILGYCAARTGAAGFNELRNALFSRVAQHSIRRIAQNVFKHLHNLDLSREMWFTSLLTIKTMLISIQP